MVIGLDTGFFIALMHKEKEALRLWNDLSLSDIPPVVSMLTIGELLYISFRLNKSDLGKQLAENIFIAANVVPVEREIVEKAAQIFILAQQLGGGVILPPEDIAIMRNFYLAKYRKLQEG